MMDKRTASIFTLILDGPSDPQMMKENETPVSISKSIEPSPETTPTEDMSLKNSANYPSSNNPIATTPNNSPCDHIHDLNAARDDSLDWDLQ